VIRGLIAGRDETPTTLFGRRAIDAATRHRACYAAKSHVEGRMSMYHVTRAGFALAVLLVWSLNVNPAEAQGPRPREVPLGELIEDCSRYEGEYVTTYGVVSSAQQDGVYGLVPRSRRADTRHLVVIASDNLSMPGVGEAWHIQGTVRCPELREFHRVGEDGRAPGTGEEEPFDWLLWGLVGVFAVLMLVLLVILLMPRSPTPEFAAAGGPGFDPQGLGGAGDEEGGFVMASDSTVTEDVFGTWKVVEGHLDGGDESQTGFLTDKVQNRGMSIGRHSTNDIVLSHTTVSRRAGKLLMRNGVLMLQVSSRGKPVHIIENEEESYEIAPGQSIEIARGTRVRFGGVTLEFEI
jgi:hypothetical protein